MVVAAFEYVPVKVTPTEFEFHSDKSMEAIEKVSPETIDRYVFALLVLFTSAVLPEY